MRTKKSSDALRRSTTGQGIRLARAARAWSRTPFAPIWFGCLLLFALSPLFAPGSLSSSSLLSMLPFAAILAIAAVGQTLVVQQRGFDLSVPGAISLAAVIITKYSAGGDDLAQALLLVVVVAIASGLASGIAISFFRISPIVATLGVNGILLGAVLQISGGSPATAPEELSELALAKTAGIPNTVIAALIVVVAVALVMNRTVVGRRFVATGANPRAARTVGISVARYQVATYVVAALCYAAAGVLLAAFLSTPSIFSGNTYLFATVAAVVIAGTPLTGGRGSVVATAVAALFLTQLESVVLSTGADTSIQYVIQGVAIAVGMALRIVSLDAVTRRLRGMTTFARVERRAR